MLNQNCRIPVIVALLAVVFPSGQWARGDTPPEIAAPAALSRQEFTKRALKISEHMTASQVEALLGEPDYIGHFGHPAAWFYGCTGERQIPTLATIYWAAKNHPILLSWFKGTPPSPSVISESELRRAMDILDRMPSILQTDPGALIHVVNALLPLGKAKILAAIQEYERVVMADIRPDRTVEWRQPLLKGNAEREAFYRTPDFHLQGPDGLVFLLRTLFDVPPSSSSISGQTLPLPYPEIGAITPAAPFDHTLSPRFPVVIVDDCPLLEITGLYMGGASARATDELPYFEKLGRLRAARLQPTDRPESILSDFEASPLWLVNQPYRLEEGYGNPRGNPTFNRPDVRLTQSVERFVKEQILRLLAPLYPEIAHIDRDALLINGFSVAIDLSQWDAVMADLKIHPVHWNPKTQEYERVARTIR